MQPTTSAHLMEFVLGRESTDYLDGRSNSTSIILTPGSSEPSRSCTARVASTFWDRFSAVGGNFYQHVDTHCG